MGNEQSTVKKNVVKRKARREQDSTLSPSTNMTAKSTMNDFFPKAPSARLVRELDLNALGADLQPLNAFLQSCEQEFEPSQLYSAGERRKFTDGTKRLSGFNAPPPAPARTYPPLLPPPPPPFTSLII